jgi:hypothetical protein
VLIEASRMVVPLGKAAARDVRAAHERAEAYERATEEIQRTLSWRITAPLRAVSGLTRPVRNR